MSMYTVIRKGGTVGSIDRAKQHGYYDAENDAAIVKQFETQEAAQEYAAALTTMWTEDLTEFPFYRPQYLVVTAK
jgi:hypothetical protein